MNSRASPSLSPPHTTQQNLVPVGEHTDSGQKPAVVNGCEPFGGTPSNDGSDQNALSRAETRRFSIISFPPKTEALAQKPLTGNSLPGYGSPNGHQHSPQRRCDGQ